MKKFIVWNPSKVDAYGGDLGDLKSDSYEGLKAAEANSDGGLSSEVETDDIDQFIDACHNEADIVLSYIEKPQEVTITLDLGDWAEIRHCIAAVDGEQLARIDKALSNELERFE